MHGPGEVSEWLKEHAWKACSREIVTWVRIPPSPPAYFLVYESVNGFFFFMYLYCSLRLAERTRARPPVGTCVKQAVRWGESV